MENLNKFLNKEGFREWMTEIRSENGYLYATDSYTIIRKKGDPIPMKFQDDNKLESFFVDKIDGQKIDRESLKNLIGEIGTENIYNSTEDDCIDCDGTGEVCCDCCDNYSECKSCDGDGYNELTTKEIIGKKYIKEIKFDGSFVRAEFIERLLELDGEILLISNIDNKLQFKVGEYDVLIMGLTNSDDYVEFKI